MRFPGFADHTLAGLGKSRKEGLSRRFPSSTRYHNPLPYEALARLTFPVPFSFPGDSQLAPMAPCSQAEIGQSTLLYSPAPGIKEEQQ